MFIILLIAWFFFIVLHFINKHYAFGIFNVIFGIMEFSGPYQFLYPEYFPNYENFSAAFSLFNQYATEESVNDYVQLIFIFLLVMNVVYIFIPNYLCKSRIIESVGNRKNKDNIEIDNDLIKIFYILFFAVFVFGLIGVYLKAGEYKFHETYNVRKPDYWHIEVKSEEEEKLRFATYGLFLLPMIVQFGILFSYQRRWYCLFLVFLACSPSIYTAFVSGHRQALALPIFIILMYFLYEKNIRIRNKAFILLGATFFFSFILTLQFVQRRIVQSGREIDFTELLNFMDYLGASNIVEAILKPTIMDFACVGGMSFRTTRLINLDSITYGYHILINTLYFIIPFLSRFSFLISNTQFQNYYINFQTEYVKMLAPVGGFSTIADFYVAFHRLTFILLPTIIGLLFRYIHVILKKNFCDIRQTSFKGICLTCFAVTCVFRFRNATMDYVRTYLYFTIVWYYTLIISKSILFPGSGTISIKEKLPSVQFVKRQISNYNRQG
ncbi:MAG: O-antigen polymerase [Candidatus Competibacteraceae bacterium]